MFYKTSARSRVNLMRGASLGVIALAAASPAFAQVAATADDNLETVVVTGTLLKGINPVGTNIVNFNAADIKATGALTTSQIYTNIPQLSNAFDVDATNGVNLNPAGGSGTANRPKLYNLSGGGGAATLFLVNGHNMVGEGFIATTPDGAEIPAMVLQRVDVVPSGGSALYGSDAVAGTINLVTRTSYEGLYAETHYGTTGNYDQYQLGFMGGHSWSSGSAYMAYEYTNNSMQLAKDRPYLRSDLVPLGGTVDSRSQNCPAANVQPNGTGTIYGLNSATVANTPGAVAAAAGATNLCDPTLATSAFDQTTSHHLFGSFTQHLGDGYDFSMVAWFGRTVSGIQQAPDTTTGTITNANPFFQAIGTETSQTVKFNYASIAGPQENSWDSLEQYEIEPELKMQFGGSWTGDLLLNYGRSASELVNPLVDSVSAANDLASSDPLNALDPYNLSLTNQTELNKLINWGNWGFNTQQLEQIRFESDGSLFSLPGGDVKLAAGAQYQYESISGRYVVGPQSQRFGAPSAGGEDNVGVGHRYVQSVFGELFVPIVGEGNEMPFVHALNVDVAARFDHYSDFGSTTNPKIGVTYEPIPGLSIRGNMGTSFNAPSLADGAGAIDTRVLPATTSTIRPGVGSMYGPATQAEDNANANRPSVLIAGGSAGLQPQKANTYQYGFDYAPDFIDGLDVSLTKWHISLYHAINMTPYTSAAVLYTPAYSKFFIINPTLAQLQTATSGIVVAGVPLASLYQNGAANTPYVLRDARRYNLGNQFISGLDFNVRYTVPTSWGSAEFGAGGTDYTENWLTGLGSSTLIDNLSTNVAPYQFIAYIGGQWGALHARATLNYSAGFTLAPNTAPGQTHAGSFEPVNLALDYDLDGAFSWSSDTTASLNVNNLFDENPPFYNNTGGLNVSGPAVGGTVNGVTLGRLFEFGLTKKF